MKLEKWQKLDDQAVVISRALAMDAVQKVGNGHPGTAMSLAPGASQTHIHRSIHLKGDTKDLEAITQQLFGVSLKELDF